VRDYVRQVFRKELWWEMVLSSAHNLW
jgi:hypothetical protein